MAAPQPGHPGKAGERRAQERRAAELDPFGQGIAPPKVYRKTPGERQDDRRFGGKAPARQGLRQIARRLEELVDAGKRVVEHPA
jgi:hypothetical protein